MADNAVKYGFRWSTTANGGRDMPVPEVCYVATSEAFNVTNGAQGVALGAGDVVTRLSTGGVTLCAGAETTTVDAYGVVVGVGPYWNAGTQRMEPTSALPSATAWGTDLNRQSKLYVVPIQAGIWEVDCDDAVTATTLAAYQAFVGENVDFVNSAPANAARPAPRIDISSHATTNTLKFNIYGISGTVENQDFSGNYVKLLLRANTIQLQKTTGIAGV